MDKKIFAIVGSFAMKPGSGKGVHIFSYEAETGDLIPLWDARPEINAGQGAYDPKRDIHYITHESRDRDGEIGGGGKILSFRLDPVSGEPRFLGETESCGVLPSYICLDMTGKYALVPHHGSGNVVTKTRRQPDGSFQAVTESDDGVLSLIRLLPDGSFGDVCDVDIVDIERDGRKIRKIPHLHSCVSSPDGKLFLVCDKGLDRIHSYRLDGENGKLARLESVFVEEGVHPRYGAFHPTLPVFYQNCENSVFVHVWQYESGTGKLFWVQKVALLPDSGAAEDFQGESGADLVLSSDGAALYLSVRGLNVISVCAVGEDGRLSLLQTVDCQGKNPRGIAVSLDGRWLYSLNRDSESITKFRIEGNKLLTPAGIATECCLPGNMRFQEKI